MPNYLFRTLRRRKSVSPKFAECANISEGPPKRFLTSVKTGRCLVRADPIDIRYARPQITCVALTSRYEVVGVATTNYRLPRPSYVSSADPREGTANAWGGVHGYTAPYASQRPSLEARESSLSDCSRPLLTPTETRECCVTPPASYSHHNFHGKPTHTRPLPGHIYALKIAAPLGKPARLACRSESSRVAYDCISVRWQIPRIWTQNGRNDLCEYVDPGCTLNVRSPPLSHDQKSDHHTSHWRFCFYFLYSRDFGDPADHDF
jgi:hypothetical protein